jgi:predicted transcriptional regulator
VFFLSKLIDLVKGLGLNQYESRAYLSLLQLKEAPVSLISDKSGIPRARVYDVLVSLQKKGFVVQKPVKPVQYSALPLKTALNSVQEKKKSNLENHFNELNAIVTSIESQIEMDSETPSSDSAVLLTGRKNIYSVIAGELTNQSSFTAPKESINSFEKHFSNKNHSVKLKESNKSKLMVLSPEKALIYLNHPENEEEEKALLINSKFLVNQLKK